MGAAENSPVLATHFSATLDVFALSFFFRHQSFYVANICHPTGYMHKRTGQTYCYQAFPPIPRIRLNYSTVLETLMPASHPGGPV